MVRRALVAMFAFASLSMFLSPAFAQFTQQGPKLVGTGAVGTDIEQGNSVSLSADGNTAIVGGSQDNGLGGAAWVFTRSGGVWTQQGLKLVGSDAVGAAWQGCSVFLSADGNTAIVGGPYDNGEVGAAWIFTRSGGVWTQQGPKLVGPDAVGAARQGGSVSLSADGNTAIVGGSLDNNWAGASWVFTRSGGVWTQQGPKLFGSDAVGPTVWQGCSVSLSADGNTAIVGGLADNDAGAAWVFTRSGGVWTQQGTKLVGSGAVGFASQGRSVAISADGNTAVVGGEGDNNLAGAAWVWVRSGGVWTQQGNKLVGSGAAGNAYQGWSVSISADGSSAIVGGFYDNNGGGAGWIWKRGGNVWSQQGTKLVGLGAVGGAQQGSSVSLSADGSTAIVGGPTDNNLAGAAWVFVKAACTSPSITIQPLSQSIASGQTATLSVTATSDATLSYQWYQGSSGVITTPVGTNSNTYTTPALTATTSYWVRVTNACGHADSSTATVTVGTGCTLACTALANPTSGNPPLTVSFSASATPSNCSGSVSYAWTFGDGATSSQENPVHTYASAGSYVWTMTASISGVTCTRTGTIAVSSQGMLTGLIGFSSTPSGVVDLPLNGSDVTVGVSAHDDNGWTATTANFDQATGRYTITGIPPQDASITIDLELWYDDHVSVGNENPLCALPAGGKVRRDIQLEFPGVPVAGGFHAFVLKKPVALIHGINACYDKWDSWASDLRDQGFVTFQPNHHFNTGSIQDVAADDVSTQLLNDFEGLTTANSGIKRPVDLICHSEGGVVARVFNTLSTWRVGKIFTLGTPHSGTDLPGASLYALDRVYMTTWFNWCRPTFGGTTVYAIAGHYFPVIGCYNSSDSVVYWTGSSSNEESPFNIYVACPSCSSGWPYTNAQPFDGQTGWIPGQQDAHNFCYWHGDLGSEPSKADILDAKIIPILKGASIKAAQRRPEEAGGPFTGASMVSVGSASIALGAGAAATMDASIGATDEAVFQAVLVVGGGALKAKDPSGTVIDSSTVQSYPGAAYSQDALGCRYTILNPKPGLWTLLFTAGSSGATGALGAEEGGVWGLTGSADAMQYLSGGNMALTARITGANPGVSAPTMNAGIADEAGQAVEQVSLFDDGLHGDGAAGDGVFGYLGPAPVTPGLYRVNFSMAGVASGFSVAREAQAGFSVLSAVSVFTGIFSDHAADDDSDGNNDHIVLTVQLDLPVAGSYTAWGDLYDVASYPVAHAVGRVEATAGGATSVDLDFEASGLGCIQFGSPFSIKDLSISGPNTLSPWQVWSSPVTTQAYNGTSFGCSEDQQPSPVIISLNPNVALPGETKNAILSGSGFLSGAQVSISGSGVILSNVARKSDGAISFTFAVDSGASVGGKDVTVTNPDGKTTKATGLLVVGQHQPPTISFMTPQDNATLFGPVPLTVTVASQRGVQAVGFKVDGVGVGSATAFPYSISWDTAPVPPGQHTITATATDVDGLGNSATIHVNVVAPPAISLMKKVSPPFKIVVTGSNFQSGIKVYIDGTQWGGVIWKNTGKVQLTGGASLKAVVPKGSTKTFHFVNSDGGEATTTWSW